MFIGFCSTVVVVVVAAAVFFCFCYKKVVAFAAQGCVDVSGLYCNKIASTAATFCRKIEKETHKETKKKKGQRMTKNFCVFVTTKVCTAARCCRHANSIEKPKNKIQQQTPPFSSITLQIENCQNKKKTKRLGIANTCTRKR